MNEFQKAAQNAARENAEQAAIQQSIAMTIAQIKGARSICGASGLVDNADNVLRIAHIVALNQASLK